MPMQFMMHSFSQKLKIQKQLISLFLILALFSCNIVFAESVGNALDVGMISTKTTQILPLFPKERDFVSIYNLVYESLLSIDDNGLPVPNLAKEYTVSNGGASIKFTIRDNVFFSDGRALTANDIAACGNHILEASKNDALEDKGYYRSLAYTIKEFKAESEKSLIVFTERPYFAALFSLTFPIVPADMLDTPNPPGTGPYVIDAFNPAQDMWLIINEKWWKQKPQVESMMIRFYQNNKDLITDYEYGRLDSAITRSLAAAQYKSGISSLSISYRTNQLEVLMLNNQAFPMQDMNIRRAIMKAIDVNSISSRVYMGMTNRAYTPFRTGDWMYADMESNYDYDLEGAKTILDELGWTDTDDDGILDILNDKGEKKNFRLRLLVYEDPENDIRYETANKIRDMLAKVKIYVKIEKTTKDGILPFLEAGSFDMALLSFQMDNAIDPGFMLISTNIKFGNYSRYRSSSMDELFTAYRKKEDPSEFAYAAKNIQLKFAEDIPFIPLFYRTGSILTRKMFTTVRDIREMEIFRGIESFTSPK